MEKSGINDTPVLTLTTETKFSGFIPELWTTLERDLVDQIKSSIWTV